LAESKNVKLYIFETYQQLKNKLPSLSQETLFYIDIELGDDINGINVAKELYQIGFRELYLATGHENIQDLKLDIFKGVIKKEVPF
jgi:hypothetical protein